MSHHTYRAARAIVRAASRAPVLLAGALCLWLWGGALTSPAGAALSPAAYRVGRLCSAPPPGYAGCLGLRLVAKRPLSQRGSRVATPALGPVGPAVEKIEFTTPWEGSLSPQNVLTAYSLSGLPAPLSTQTLALVDAYNDPTIEHDLKVFDEQFALSPCTTANGCLTKVEMRGGAQDKTPATNAGWAQEISTDVELAHGLCSGCKILLVEAYSNENSELEAAEAEAERRGATEISNSWGGSEQGVTVREDETDAFNHPGTVITASAGDDGYLDWGAEESSERGYPDYPASSPHVIAVGGTRLGVTAAGKWREETVWNGDGAGGGGCSTVLSAPAWQQSLTDWLSVGCGSHRAVADVSADADPYTGVAVYDSTPVREGEIEYHGWVTIGGTSVASPIIASTFALAGGAGADAQDETVKYPARTLYENLAAHPEALHDVTSGSNGACSKGFDETTGLSDCSLGEEGSSCSDTAICVAGPGYDGPTGVGTPNGITAFETESEAERTKKLEEERTAAEKKTAEELKAAEEKKAKEKKAAEEKQATEKQAEEERKLAEEKTIEEEAGAGAGSGKEPGAPAGSSGASEVAATTNGQPNAVASGGTLTTGVLSSGSLQPPAPAAVVPVLSAPALTRIATVALNRAGGHPRISQVAFAFTLNVAAHVHVGLARQVLAHGRRTRWQTLLSYSLTIAAAPGRDRAHLSAHGRLAAGRYRLTLTPAHGNARTLTFQVG
jgi:hypothetical protein